MKTDIFCVFVVVLLVISPAAFGEIIPDEVAIGEGSSWGTCISVHANSSTPEDSAYGGGYQSYYTTEGGTFTRYYELYTRTSVALTLVSGNTCEAYAYGVAIGADDIHGSQQMSFTSSRSESGYGGQQKFDHDEPEGGIYAYYSDPMEAGDGISASHYAYVEASIVAGNYDSAYAMVEATAWCSMY